MTLKEVAVCCAVIIHDGKVFVARRGKHSKQALKWEFPGGKLEPDETELDCLHRELAEELQMKVVAVKKLPEFTHCYPDFIVKLIPYHCRLTSHHYSLSEHAQIAWLLPDDLPNLDWAAADVQLMEYVCKQLF